MPRTLPWLVEQPKNGRVKQESTPRKRVKRETDTDLTPRKPPSSPENKDFFRSSQTPPTSPARPCPTEEFLIEGFDKDDAWIMVEDEFYAVAQSFTQHLHYAEYVRRKKEAKAQSAAAIRDLERPTDGQTPMPKSLQLRKDAEALAAHQKESLAQLEEPGNNNQEESDEEDDAWAGTHLHSLMTSPRKVRSLVGVQGVKSFTRAAAGFGHASSSINNGRMASSSRPRSPSIHASTRSAQSHDVEVGVETASEEEEVEEDDDLDGETHVTPRPLTRSLDGPKSKIHDRQNDFFKAQSIDSSKTPTAKQKVTTKFSKQPASGFKSKVQMLFDDIDELPAPSQSSSSISDRKMEAKSGANTPNKPNTDKNLDSKSRYKDVPTFLM